MNQINKRFLDIKPNSHLKCSKPNSEIQPITDIAENRKISELNSSNTVILTFSIKLKDKKINPDKVKSTTQYNNKSDNETVVTKEITLSGSNNDNNILDNKLMTIKLKPNKNG